MAPEIKLVSLNEISTDTSFCFHTKPWDEKIFASIQEIGLLTPLLLGKQGERLLVLDGFCRREAYRRLGLITIPAFIFEGINEASFLRIVVEANRWVRPFNFIEKGLILKKGFSLRDQDSSLENWLYTVLEVSHQHQAKNLQELLKLPEKVIDYILKHQLPLNVALKWMVFSPKVQESLVRHLSLLPLNQNNLSYLLDRLLEISRRDQQEASTIFQNLLQEIHEENPFNRLNILKDQIDFLRYPRYHEKKKDFEKKVKALHLIKGVQLTPSPYFEEKTVELKASLKSAEDLKNLREEMDQKKWKMLWED